MIVDREHYPHVRAAFEAIECDGGAHHIGRIYPGMAINLDAFTVPDAWAHLLPGADRALANIAAASLKLLETFVIGEQSEAEEIERRFGELSEARILLDDFFNGWQPEDQPFKQLDTCQRPEGE